MRITSLTLGASALALLAAPAASQTCGSGAGDIISTTASSGGTWGVTLPTAGFLTLPAVLPADATSIDSIKLNALGHTWAGDVQILLEDPAGDKHTLISRVAYGNTSTLGVNCDYDGGDYTIVESGGTGVWPADSTDCPTGFIAADTYDQYLGGCCGVWPDGVDGVFNTALSAIPVVPGGTYNLLIYDWAAGDGGSLGSWEICGTGSGPVPPEIIEYNFDGGDATNTAVPGVGDGTPNAGVGFGPGFCDNAGNPAAISVASPGIDAGWQVDIGASDYTVGMNLDLTAGGAVFQYAFGSPSTGGWRCFARGAAGTEGIMLRTLGGGDVIIAGGASSTAATHVCWVYDSSVPEVRGYLNGVLNNAVTQTAPANLIGTAADFVVMTYSTPMAAGNMIDDFRLYRRAITQGEIDDWVANCPAPPGPIGTNFECPTTATNSSGNAATIQAIGTDVVADNNVTLHASGMPTLTPTPGYFLNSQIANPAGFALPASQGRLCIGVTNIGRYNASVFNAAGTGEGSLVLDLANTPTASGPVAIQAGETWYFTAWFRDDNPGHTSNLSDAVCVTFQ